MSEGDAFSRFVGCLAGALNEEELSSADLAARLHLSRSHFDRLVTASAGEPPARFRRRVLLERAAFRLLSSEVSVTCAAHEAGYTSHEGFTRAFTRAYGVGPREWRRAPTAVLLDAPNGVHFHPPAGLRLPSSGKTGTAMDLIVRMVEHHVWLVTEMIERAARLDTAVLDQPLTTNSDVDDEPTVRSLLSRLVGQMDMWNKTINMQEYDWGVEQGECLGSMRDRLGVAGPAFLDQVRRTAGEGRLDDTFVSTLDTPAKVYTYGGLIAHVLTFAAYRRTVVLGALSTAGAGDLGYGDPRDWVAEAH